jgi:hypothetical protein
MHKVLVGRQQRQFVPYAKLRKQGIDSAHLYARSAACVSDSCSANVIVSVWLYEWESSKPLNDLCLRLRSGEALEKFLEDKPRSDDDLVSQECVFEGLNLGLTCFSVPP